MMPDSDLVDCIMQVMGAAFDPAYGEAWNRRQISDALVMPNTHASLIDCYGALIDLQNLAEDVSPAGFTLSRYAADEEELLLIAISPRWQGRGFAKTLIKDLIKNAKQRSVRHLFLEMREGNPAIHLYQSLGFETIGRRPNYYQFADSTRQDAITFRLVI